MMVIQSTNAENVSPTFLNNSSLKLLPRYHTHAGFISKTVSPLSNSALASYF